MIPQRGNEVVRESAGAVFASVGFALLFWLLGIRIVPRVGAVQTVWTIRLTSTLLMAAASFIVKQPVNLPRGEVRWMVLSMGAFDTGAFVLSNLGMKMEQVAVISVLGSLYGAVTVGLAAIFLREHVFALAVDGHRHYFRGNLSDQPIATLP